MAPNVCRVYQFLSGSLTMVLIAIVRYLLPALSCICIASWVSWPPFLGTLSSSCKWGKWSSATQVPWYQAGHTGLWSWSSLISKSVVFRWRHLTTPRAAQDPPAARTAILILISQRREARLKVTRFPCMTELKRKDGEAGTHAFVSSRNCRCYGRHFFAIILIMLKNIRSCM